MVLFSDLVLGASFPEHVACLKLAMTVVDWLLHAKIEDLLANLEHLSRVIEQYRELSVRLYPSMDRPKIHYIVHLPDYIRKTRANLNCFGPERRHRSVKMVVGHTYADKVDKHAIKKLTRQHMYTLGQD
eukprot:4214418-Pyramimonas_sp.AAC.1